MGKILPILLVLIGLGGGIGAGMALRPAPEEVTIINPCGDETMADTGHGEDAAHGEETVETEGDGHGEEDIATSEFVKLNNQFVIPVVTDGSVAALVVMSLSIEMDSGGREVVYQREPKLRDAFLQVLFDHANTGGFDGVFTEGTKLDNLRSALLETARKVVGEQVRDVLMADILRQDI